MHRLGLIAVVLLAGCGKKSTVGRPTGPANFFTYDRPAADLQGMTPYQEANPGLQMGIAEGWKGFNGTAFFAAVHHANPQVGGMQVDVSQHDAIKLLDWRPETVRDVYLPLFRVNAFRQTNASLDDAQRQFMAKLTPPSEYRRLADERFGGGVAAHLVGTTTGRNLLEKDIPVVSELYVFANAERIVVVQATYLKEQTTVPGDVRRMVESLRFRKPDPAASDSIPPQPYTPPGISAGPPGMMSDGRPYDPQRDNPRSGFSPPPVPPTGGMPTMPNPNEGGLAGGATQGETAPGPSNDGGLPPAPPAAGP